MNNLIIEIAVPIILGAIILTGLWIASRSKGNIKLKMNVQKGIIEFEKSEPREPKK